LGAPLRCQGRRANSQALAIEKRASVNAHAYQLEVFSQDPEHSLKERDLAAGWNVHPGKERQCRGLRAVEQVQRMQEE
jgi:hypothetical protein